MQITDIIFEILFIRIYVYFVKMLYFKVLYIYIYTYVNCFTAEFSLFFYTIKIFIKNLMSTPNRTYF